jgi:hypothetical protein
MGPRQVWWDFSRSVRGAVAFQRYLCSRDSIDIALGMVEASSSRVSIGQPCRYVIRLANVSAQVQTVKVTLEMSLHRAAPMSAELAASFTKHCTALPRRATQVECQYDWRSAAVFVVDSTVSPPDEFCEGEIKTLQRYRVRTILCDHRGKWLDHLDIYQEL